MEVSIAAPAKVPLLPIANIIEGILFVAALGGRWHLRVFSVVSNGDAYPRWPCCTHFCEGGCSPLSGEKWTIQHKDVNYQLVISTTQRRNYPFFSRTRLWVKLCTFLLDRELFCSQLLKVQKMDFWGCEHTKSQIFDHKIFFLVGIAQISAFPTLEYTWKPDSSINYSSIAASPRLVSW